MSATLDLSGGRLDLVVRAGADNVVRLGPWKDASGALIDFSGGTLDGTVSKRGAADTPQALVFEDVVPGFVNVRLPNSASWDAGSFFTAKSTYNYAIFFTDSAGDRMPQLVGEIKVAASGPE